MYGIKWMSAEAFQAAGIERAKISPSVVVVVVVVAVVTKRL
jgi:hypothetical protein